MIFPITLTDSSNTEHLHQYSAGISRLLTVKQEEIRNLLRAMWPVIARVYVMVRAHTALINQLADNDDRKELLVSFKFHPPVTWYSDSEISFFFLQHLAGYRERRYFL